MHILAAGSGLQRNINNSVVVIISSLFSLLNTSAGLDAGTEILRHAHARSFCAHLNTCEHSKTLCSNTGGSWPLSGAVYPPSCVTHTHTHTHSTVSLKLQTAAFMSARVGVSSIQSIPNVNLNCNLFTNDGSFPVAPPWYLFSVASLSSRELFFRRVWKEIRH